MDIAEVQRLKSDLQSIWGNAHATMNEMLELYELEYALQTKEGFRPSRPPTGPRIVDTAADHILVSHEVITVKPRKNTQEGQAQADKLEPLYKAVADGWDRYEPDPVLKQLARNAFVFGLGVRKGPFWNDDIPDQLVREKGEHKKAFEQRREEREQERVAFLPFLSRSVDPRQVLFPVDSFPPPFVIEVGRRTVRYIEETYGVRLENHQDSDVVDWLEYWDKKRRFFLAGGVPVLPESGTVNVGGFIPYSFVFSGLGRTPAYAFGETLDPSVMARSLLFNVRHSIIEEAELTSALRAIIKTHGYPQYVLEEGAALRIHWEEGPAGNVVVPDGYKLTLLEMPKSLPDIYSRLQLIRQEIAEATFSGVLEGQPPRGVEAGYPMALLITQAKMKFGGLIENLRRARSQMLGNCARLMEALDESITVTARSPDGKRKDVVVTPEDIDGYYEVEVDLSGVSPEEADRRTMLGLNMRKPGPDGLPEISRRTFLEKFAMRPDASDEVNQILIESLLSSDEVRQVLIQLLLQQQGNIELRQATEQAQAQQTAAQGMAGGGAGMPGLTPQVPGVPQGPTQPGTAEALALQQRQLQTLGGRTQQVGPMGSSREVM